VRGVFGGGGMGYSDDESRRMRSTFGDAERVVRIFKANNIVGWGNHPRSAPLAEGLYLHAKKAARGKGRPVWSISAGEERDFPQTGRDRWGGEMRLTAKRDGRDVNGPWVRGLHWKRFQEDGSKAQVLKVEKGG